MRFICETKERGMQRFRASEYKEQKMFESVEIADGERANLAGSMAELAEGKVYYQMEGPESGELVVLIHGMSIPSFVWDPTWEILAAEGFRVLRYDLFGRGYSDRPNIQHSLDNYVSQLQELLKVLNLNDQKMSLFGFSLGAGIAAAFAAQQADQVHRICLIDPIHPDDMPDPPAKIWKKILKLKFMAVTVDQKVIDGLPYNFYRYEDFPDFEEQLSEQLQYKRSALAITSTLIDFDYDALPEIFEQVEQLDIPSCLIWGREDKQADIETSAEFRKLMPSIQLHVIEEAGHLSHYERPDVANPILLEFLRS